MMATDSKDINIELALGACGDVQPDAGVAAEGASRTELIPGTETSPPDATKCSTQQLDQRQRAEPELSNAEQELESGEQQQSLPYAPIPVPTISEQVADDSPGGKKKRVPRRILHFSDGTLEEYSTDEEEEDEVDATEQQLQKLRLTDTSGLSWLQWSWHWLCLAGYNTLSRVDATGEKLAWFLGITSPKYQYELDEYYEMQRKEKEEKEQRDLEAAGWTPGSEKTTNPSAAYKVSDQSETSTQSVVQSAPVAAVTSEPVCGQPVSAEARA